MLDRCGILSEQFSAFMARLASGLCFNLGDLTASWRCSVAYIWWDRSYWNRRRCKSMFSIHWNIQISYVKWHYFSSPAWERLHYWILSDIFWTSWKTIISIALCVRQKHHILQLKYLDPISEWIHCHPLPCLQRLRCSSFETCWVSLPNQGFSSFETSRFIPNTRTHF